MKPFLKWAGGKFRVLTHIKPLLPSGKRLIEPFVGSGAVFLNTEYSQYVLADNNPDLIHLYRILQKEKTKFINYSKLLFTAENNCKEAYIDLRAEFNASTDRRRKAAIFLYLNRFGFNGLCRYNSKGIFNVPFGSYNKPFFPEESMKAFASKLKTVIITTSDFVDTMQQAERGDVIYCDPPYIPISDTAFFTGYSKHQFGLPQQERLASLSEELATRGVTVLVSNHDTPYSRKLYRKSQLKTFPAARLISCKTEKRFPVSEVLALYEAR